MFRFIITLLALLFAAELIWPMIGRNHDLSMRDMGMTFNFHELIGYAYALTAAMPLISLESKSQVGDGLLRAIVSVLIGICLASLSWGACLGLGIIGAAYLLKVPQAVSS